MPSALLECPNCRQSHALAALLDGDVRWVRSVDAVRMVCPTDGKGIEARLADGLVMWGYVYASGSLHFAGMVDVKVGGLAVSVGDELEVTLGERCWAFSSHERW